MAKRGTVNHALAHACFASHDLRPIPLGPHDTDMKCAHVQGTRSPKWKNELHVTTAALDNDNNNGRPDRKHALIHRRATLEYRSNCQTRYFCKHAPMNSPKIRQKTKTMYAGLCKNIAFRKGISLPANSDLSFRADVLHRGVAYYRIRSEGLAETAYAFGKQTLLWFGHGCSGYRTHSEHEQNFIMVWAWILWLSDALGTRTSVWFGHGCSVYRMHSERERHSGLGLDALVSVCTRNTRYYGLGLDALVSVCTRNTNVIMVWAWMLW